VEKDSSEGTWKEDALTRKKNAGVSPTMSRRKDYIGSPVRKGKDRKMIKNKRRD